MSVAGFTNEFERSLLSLLMMSKQAVKVTKYILFATADPLMVKDGRGNF